MKSLKRKALRFLPLLVLPLSLAVVATRVKSAAEFPNPCMGDGYFELTTSTMAERKPDGDLQALHWDRGRPARLKIR